MTDQSNRSADALAAELRRVIEQAEHLLQAIGVDGEALGGLQDRVNGTIGQAREKLADLEREARAGGRRAAAATETWVRANPWTALTIGAGIGLILGALLLGRSGPAAPAGPDGDDG